MASKRAMKLIQKIIFFFEMRSYGVCSWFARKLGIRSSQVRVAFIYASFVTLGSSLLLYLPMAWILEHKHFFKLQKKRKTSIWEL